jgi:hypothetical protein
MEWVIQMFQTKRLARTSSHMRLLLMQLARALFNQPNKQTLRNNSYVNAQQWIHTVLTYNFY